MPQVYDIVSKLREAGNESVYGIVDWDTKNESKDGVLVLAHDERYAIENCLLDPLLIAAVLAREDLNEARSVGFPQGKTYFDFPQLKPTQMQTLVDGVQNRVLGEKTEGTSMSDICYMGLEGIVARQDFLRMRGHDLEDKVREAFPPLKRFHQAGKILDFVIMSILSEMPAFMPIPLVNIFEGLLK